MNFQTKVSIIVDTNLSIILNLDHHVPGYALEGDLLVLHQHPLLCLLLQNLPTKLYAAWSSNLEVESQDSRSGEEIEVLPSSHLQSE